MSDISGVKSRDREYMPQKARVNIMLDSVNHGCRNQRDLAERNKTKRHCLYTLYRSSKQNERQKATNGKLYLLCSFSGNAEKHVRGVLHLLRPDDLELLGRVREVGSVVLGPELANIGLLDEPLVTCFPPSVIIHVQCSTASHPASRRTQSHPPST